SDAARIFVVPAPHTDDHTVSFWDDDAGRPHFDVEFVNPSGFQLLYLIVRVVRPVRPAALAVEFAVRCPQPALRNGRMWIGMALEGDLLQLRIKDPDHHENIRVFG